MTLKSSKIRSLIPIEKRYHYQKNKNIMYGLSYIICGIGIVM